MDSDGIVARLVVPGDQPAPVTAPGAPVPSGAPADRPGLPRTGTELLAVLLLAVALLALGVLLVRAGRNRRRLPALPTP